MRQHAPIVPLLLAAAAALLPRTADAQYALNSALFNETYALAVSALERRLVSAAVAAASSSGSRAAPAALLARSEPVIAYASVPSQPSYTQNVLFDPCRYSAAGCCADTYGVAEFARSATASDVGAVGAAGDGTFLLREDGSALPHASARTADQDLYANADCTGAGSPFPSCVAQLLARRPSGMHAVCGNFNASIEAGVPCRAPSDGSPLELCVEVAIMQTAAVLECGGAAEAQPSCGTFLEVHRPGDERELAATRIPALLASGYRSLVLSTTYRRSSQRVLCFDPVAQGAYEVWWVTRSRRPLPPVAPAAGAAVSGSSGSAAGASMPPSRQQRDVARRIPFRIVSPLCDWDALNNRYQPYATVAEALPLVGQAPRFLFSRERPDGTPDGRPGIGMGTTLVPRSNSSYPPNASFAFDSWSAYLWRLGAAKVDYTVARGIREP